MVINEEDRVITKLDLTHAGDFIMESRKQALKDDIYDIKKCDGFHDLPEVTRFLITVGYTDKDGNQTNPLARVQKTED